MNGSDCGWWAVYYALMTIYTGGVEFLNTLKGRKLSAEPLRNIMNLQEAIEQESLQNKENHSPNPINGGHRSGSINEIQRKSSRLEERTSTKSQNKRSSASGVRLLSEDFERHLTGNHYQLWFKNYVISDIAEHIYGWTESSNIIFGVEVCGQLLEKLDKFKKNKDKTLIYIVNKSGNHWVTLVAIHTNEQEDVFFYADSFGVGIEECRVNSLGRGKIGSDVKNKVSQGEVDCNGQNVKQNSDNDVIFVKETVPLINDNIRIPLDEFLEREGFSKNNIHSVSCKQQNDTYNCGVFALVNAEAILNAMTNGNDDPAKIKESLKAVNKGSEFLNTLRKGFAEGLKEISNSTADKEAVKKRFTEKSKNLFSDLENLLKLDRRMSNLKPIIKNFVEKHTKGSNFLSRLLLGRVENWRASLGFGG